MHYSSHTVKNRRIELGYFIDWCEERSISRPDEVTRALLERYRQHVFHYRRKDNGTPLSFQTQHKRLISVRMFFQWLTRQYHLLFNPASELELPRTEQRLPRHVLNVAEVEQVINAIEVEEPTGLGVRDRAMLETLYSTGMRRGELVALRIDDVDLREGTVFIRLGKGKKDRVVPIGARACAWIEKYLYTIRPRYLEGDDPGPCSSPNMAPEWTASSSPASSSAPSSEPLWSGSRTRIRTPPATCCATPARPTCWRTAPTSATSRHSSVMPISRLLKSTRACRS